MRLAEYLLGCSDKERADMHMEIARAYRKRGLTNNVDYLVDGKTLVETEKKRKHK